MAENEVAGIGFMKQLAVGIFVIVIIFFALAIAGANLKTASITQESNTILNESGYINSSQYTVTNASTSGFTGFSVTEIRNASNQIVIGVANYTAISNGSIINATVTEWEDVDIDYAFSKPTSGVAGSIIDSFTSAISDFGSNVATWLVLGSLVVLISIIVIIILVVNRVSMGGGKNNL